MEPLSALVTAAQNGSKAAFDAIVRRFQDMAYAGAYALLGDSHQAQDAAQEAFIDAYLSLDKLREPAAFPGWFRRNGCPRSWTRLITRWIRRTARRCFCPATRNLIPASGG